MRVAVVGLGFMGVTHLKGYKNIPGVEISAVSANDPKALSGDLSSIGGNLNVGGDTADFSKAAKYEDPFECVRDPDVEAVDICLPTNLHASVALEALKNGKHVLVEKPMGLTGEECDSLIAAAKSARRILMSAQVLRFFPAYIPLLEGVKSGKFGTVRHAMFRRRCAAPAWSAWLTEKDLSGGGVFDLLIHDVDMALAAFGVPEAVSAVGSEDLWRGIDLITAQLHYANGPAVTITGGWHLPKAYPFSMEYTVAGDHAVLDYSSEGREPKWYSADGLATPAELPSTDGYQAEIEYFLECCRTGNAPERCPPESSAAAVKITRLMAEARRKNGEKVPCQI